MSSYGTVAIVGVGLIGASIGKALIQRRLAAEVVGIGRRATMLRAARQAGAVTRTTNDLARGVAGAELIVVCTPVDCIVGHVRSAAAACPDGALVTDAGSTKEQIVAELDGRLPRGVRFVGGHPLAGSEKSGPRHARADLFVDRQVVLTPTRRSRAEDVKRLERFWSALGADVVCMSAAQHDRLVAAASHLPHLVAAALAAATPEVALRLAAGGWKDTTRIAAGDPALWRPIFASNRAHVLKAIGAFEKTWTLLRRALEQRDDEALLRMLQQAQRKAAAGNSKSTDQG